MLLDIAIGIFSSIFISWFFDFEISAPLILIGVAFSLLPDLDFLFYRIKHGTKNKDHKHRDIFHYPILYILFGFLVLYFLNFDKYFIALFVLASFSHFVHDSIAIGWGVKWLYPFYRNNFAFFYLYSSKDKQGLKKMIFSFDEKSMDYYEKEHGDPDWIKNIYYRWHPIAIVEFLFFIISAVALFLYYFNSK